MSVYDKIKLNLKNLDLNRFRKSNGEKIYDVAQYVKDYVNKKRGVIRIGTDSKLYKGKSLNYTSIAFDAGPYGQHVISMKSIVSIPGLTWLDSSEYARLSKAKKKQRRDEMKMLVIYRLYAETIISVYLADYLVENGLEKHLIDCIELDYNSSDEHQSYVISHTCTGECAYRGYRSTLKSGNDSVIRYSDFLCK